MNKYAENQNLEQDFEPGLIITRETLGRAVGASSQKAGQRWAHHSPRCGRTLPNACWPRPLGNGS